MNNDNDDRRRGTGLEWGAGLTPVKGEREGAGSGGKSPDQSELHEALCQANRSSGAQLGRCGEPLSFLRLSDPLELLGEHGPWGARWADSEDIAAGAVRHLNLLQQVLS